MAVDPVRIGVQKKPPAIILLYTRGGSNHQLRKRVMPLRSLGESLGAEGAVRKLVEAHSAFLSPAKVSSEQLMRLVSGLIESRRKQASPPSVISKAPVDERGGDPAPTAGPQPASTADQPSSVSASTATAAEAVAAADVVEDLSDWDEEDVASPCDAKGESDQPGQSASSDADAPAMESHGKPTLESHAEPPPASMPPASVPSASVPPVAAPPASVPPASSPQPVVADSSRGQSPLDRGLLRELACDLDSSSGSVGSAGSIVETSADAVPSLGRLPPGALTTMGSAPTRTESLRTSGGPAARDLMPSAATASAANRPSSVSAAAAVAAATAAADAIEDLSDDWDEDDVAGECNAKAESVQPVQSAPDGADAPGTATTAPARPGGGLSASKLAPLGGATAKPGAKALAPIIGGGTLAPLDAPPSASIGSKMGNGPPSARVNGILPPRPSSFASAPATKVPMASSATRPPLATGWGGGGQMWTSSTRLKISATSISTTISTVRRRRHPSRHPSRRRRMRRLLRRPLKEAARPRAPMGRSAAAMAAAAAATDALPLPSPRDGSRRQ